jgi:polyhydroxyalkanoate synthesis regulator phasin
MSRAYLRVEDELLSLSEELADRCGEINELRERVRKLEAENKTLADEEFDKECIEKAAKYNALREAVRPALGLLNSMVLSGEQHTGQSRKVFREAMNTLTESGNDKGVDE